MMFLALLAYLRVDRVSPWLTSAGEMVAIMMVLAFPPSESLSSHVSVESRYGMKVFLLLLAAEAASLSAVI